MKLVNFLHFEKSFPSCKIASYLPASLGCDRAVGRPDLVFGYF